MKKNIDFSQFFISPDAWDSVIPVDQKNPITEFNKLNMETKFTESLEDLSSLNHFFQELIFYIKKENIHYVNNLVFGFIPILLNITDTYDNILTDSSFFQISKLMFNNIYKRNQKYSSILIAVSLFDILSSNLPITISYGHLYHIQEEQAQLIHQYLYEGSDYSLSTKCLAASLAFSSTRFNKNNPQYPSYCQILDSIDQTKLQFLPDPTVMLEQSKFFTSSELILASFVVQYTNSLVFSIGLDQLNLQNDDHQTEKVHTVLNMKRCCALQILVTSGDLTAGSLSHSIRIHSLQKDTSPSLHNFFRAMDCPVGIEITKELFLLNTTQSFAKLSSSLGSSALAGFFRTIETANDRETDVLLPFHSRIESLHTVISHLVEMTKTDEDRQFVLHFLGTLHSLLLRIKSESLTTTYTVIAEHCIGLSFAVHAFFEMLTLQPMFEKAEVTRLCVCVAGLVFENACKLAVRSMSSSFLRDTLEFCMYLMHVPADSVSFLLFDVVRAFKAVRDFTASHESVMRAFMKRAMPDVLLPSASVLLSSFKSKDESDISLILRVVNYACRSYMPHVFYAARACVLSFCSDAEEDVFAAFSKKFFDLYLSIISPTNLHVRETDGFIFNPTKFYTEKEDYEDSCHTQTLYLLLLADVLKFRDASLMYFTSHPVFTSFYADAQKVLDTSRSPYSSIVCPVTEIMAAVWKFAGAALDEAGFVVGSDKEREVVIVGDDDTSDQLSTEKSSDKVVDIPRLNHLLGDISFLWAPTASSVLSTALEVSRKVGSLVYDVKADEVFASAAENAFEFITELHLIDPARIQDVSLERRAKEEKENANPGPSECGLPWMSAYDYDFIIEQRPMVVSQRNVNLPNSQIIKEDEDEEEEEEEEKDNDSSEF